MKVFERLDRWLWYSIRRRLLDEDLKVLKNHMHGNVLEVGSGRQGRRGYFKPPFETADTWIHLDSEDKRKPHIRGDVEHLCFRRGILDSIVCLEVLEYVTHPQAAIEEMYRALRVGGNLILAAPFLHRVDHPHDYWRFTEHGLKYLLTESGFAIQRFKMQGAAMSVLVNVIKYMIYALPTFWLRTLLGLLAYLPLTVVLKLDRRVTRRLPVSQTFSTGYLVHAVRQ